MNTEKEKVVTKKATAKTTKKAPPKKVAKKEPVKKVAKKDTKIPTSALVEAELDREVFISTWRLNTKKSIGTLVKGERTEASDKAFPAYCRAAGMEHSQVVRAVEIVRGFAHEVKAITNELIKEQKDQIGDEKLSVSVPVTGLDDGRGGTPKVIVEHQRKGVTVATPDGNRTADLNTVINTTHLGPTKLGRLTKK